MCLSFEGTLGRFRVFISKTRVVFHGNEPKFWKSDFVNIWSTKVLTVEIRVRPWSNEAVNGKRRATDGTVNANALNANFTAYRSLYGHVCKTENNPNLIQCSRFRCTQNKLYRSLRAVNLKKCMWSKSTRMSRIDRLTKFFCLPYLGEKRPRFSTSMTSKTPKKSRFSRIFCSPDDSTGAEKYLRKPRIIRVQRK